MATFFLDNPYAKLGEGVGQGIGGLLQNLASQKAQQLSQQNYRNLLIMSGVPEQQAQAISMMPEQDRFNAFKVLAQSGGLAPRQDSLGGMLDSGLGMVREAPASSQMNTEAPQDAISQRIQSLMNPPRPTNLAQALSSPKQLTPSEQIKVLQGERENIREEQKIRETREHRQQALKLKARERIESRNAPYLKTIREEVALAEPIKSEALKALAILNTGQVASQLEGLAPGITRNTETQEFEGAINNLTGLRAAEYGGVTTDAKLKLAASTKPSLTDRPETQRFKLVETIKEANKPYLRDMARKDILAKNKNEEPENFEDLIKDRVKKFEALDKKLGTPASMAEEGTIIEDEKTGKQYISDTIRWIPLKKGK